MCERGGVGEELNFNYGVNWPISMQNYVLKLFIHFYTLFVHCCTILYILEHFVYIVFHTITRTVHDQRNLGKKS